MIRPAIVPSQRDVAAWRMQAEAANKFGGVRLGDFDWPWVVLSLASAWERDNDLVNENARLRAMIRVNMLRWYPDMSHADIDQEIARAVSK